ncbi:MAG TPA: T9SS type A sorting domain-containing protein [Bacteroidia bacterium]
MASNLSLSAQALPNGVSLKDETNYQAKFFFQDKNKNLWVGPISYHNAGLFHYNSNFQKTVDFSFGSFTGATELNNSVYFSSLNGLYTYSNSSFSLDSSIRDLSNIAQYHDSIYVISADTALYRYYGGAFSRIDLSALGNVYLYSIKTDNNSIWLGSSLGLIRLNGNNTQLYRIKSQPGQDSSNIAYNQNIQNIVINKNGDVWAMNENSHQAIFKVSGDSLLYQDLSDALNCHQKSMVPIGINDLCFDTAGNMLLSTTHYVLLFSDTVKLMVPDYKTLKDDARYTEEDLYVGDLSKILIDSNDVLYFYNGNLYTINLVNYNDQLIRNSYAKEFRSRAVDVNDLKANISNDGYLFNNDKPFDTFFGKTNFESKSFDCAKLLSVAGLWVSASYDYNVYASANHNRIKGSDFYPGPLDTRYGTFDSAAAAPYNRIWKVSHDEIEFFKKNYNNSSYTIPKDILEWPAHGTGNFSKNLAPFIDLDKNGIYEPLKGDYPKIKGNVMYWWVFNDVFKRQSSAASPLGLEVHASCYAFNCDDLNLNDTNYILNRTLFFDFKFINRSKTVYSTFNAGMYNQAGMGYPYDNYIGCDVEMNAGYVYNGDKRDDLSWNFGKRSPILFCKLLNQDLYSFNTFTSNNDIVNGAPTMGVDYYNYMIGKWKNGVAFKYGGNGLNGSVATRYMYDNGTAGFNNFPKWNEHTAGNFASGRLFTVNAQMNNFMPDSTESMELAYIFSEKENMDFLNHYDDFHRKNLRLVQYWYDQNRYPYCTGTSSIDKTEKAIKTFQIYPNPSGNTLHIKDENPDNKIVKIVIMDISGCVLENIPYSNSDKDVIADVSTLIVGTYLIQIHSEKGIYTQKFLKL